MPDPFAQFTRPPIAPPPAAPVTTLLTPGAAPGTVIRPTAAEAKALAALKWDEAEPVPGNLAEIIAAHSAAAKQAAAQPLERPDGLPPLVIPSAVPIETLAPERQEAIRRDMAATLAFTRQREAAAEAAAAAPQIPGYREAMAVAQGQTAATEVTPRGTWAQAGRDESGASLVQPIAAMFERVKQATAQAQPDEPAVAAPEVAPPSAHATNCVHCGWDQDLPDEIAPSPTDKLAYLAMILGGPEVRFRKDVAFYNGALVATYRTLTTAESELTWQQLAHDQKAGRHAGGMAQYNALQAYRFVAMLDSIATRGGGVTAVPEVGASQAHGGETVLPELLDVLRARVLTHEQLWATVFSGFQRFQQLVVKLEVSACSPDFWDGTGAPP